MSDYSDGSEREELNKAYELRKKVKHLPLSLFTLNDLKGINRVMTLKPYLEDYLYFEKISQIKNIEKDTKTNTLVLSPWTPDPKSPHACMRYIIGTDMNVIANRIAFIEVTPRVRLRPFTGTPNNEILENDWRNWEYGDEGVGGYSLDFAKNKVFGFYPPAREWADKRLLDMGYILT